MLITCNNCSIQINVVINTNCIMLRDPAHPQVRVYKPDHWTRRGRSPLQPELSTPLLNKAPDQLFVYFTHFRPFYWSQHWRQAKLQARKVFNVLESDEPWQLWWQGPATASTCGKAAAPASLATALDQGRLVSRGPGSIARRASSVVATTGCQPPHRSKEQCC